MIPRPDARDIQHVGHFVRSNIIPSDLTVTEAAKLLGIGRPALSNFLNGRAKLSTTMALRLERVFNADSQQLLDLQAEIDRRSVENSGKQLVTSAYAPSVLTIRAAEIEQWANRFESRNKLAVLLRKLVHSTGVGITHADFPGHENAERHGWDGYVESDGQTPWVPGGASGWEFGTGQDPRAKANSDYRARLASVPPEERYGCSFVFVTPRNWPGKSDWAREKSALGHWLAVRAYDASDLEQWVEQSVPAQVWLAEEIGETVTGYRSLEECWRTWADVTAPPLSSSLFRPALDIHSKTLENWLANPPSSPMVIAADSKDEAIAFISRVAEGEEAGAGSWGSQAVVFETPESFQRLARSLPPSLVAISSNLDVEREMAPHSGTVHCIFVRPGGLVDSKPDVTLERLSRDDFRSALKEMGMSRDRIGQLDRESARSPTILRRRLASHDIVREPPWARDEAIARKLGPMALLGSWVKDSPSDQEVMKFLARVEAYESVESDIASLLRLEDSPVWRAGHHRGVASAIDSMFAIGWTITEQQLDNFFLVAEYVLSEKDPALELPADEQWMAPVYDKVRNHSGALRNGICQTLELLATHGDEMLRRSELDLRRRVGGLVRGLIVQSSDGELLSLHRDLPDLAEAAPDVFLTFVEDDLRKEQPAVLQLFNSGGDPLFSAHRHTGLLWALERLAWDPENLPRVIRILAKLCPVQLPENLANTPMASLAAIFRCWIPQTAATLEQRIEALKLLSREFPEVGWDVCMQQMGRGREFAMPSERPRWRSDASNAGYGAPDSERQRFIEVAVDTALTWTSHDENKLGDLADRVDVLTEDERGVLWYLIDEWFRSDTYDMARAKLWNRLRMRVNLVGVSDAGMLATIQKLEPSSPARRHQWMFSRECKDYPEIVRNPNDDYKVLEQRILRMRRDALSEIWESSGFEGVALLVESSEEAPFLVGRVMPDVLTGDDSLHYITQACIEASNGDSSSPYAHFLRVVLLGSVAVDLECLLEGAQRTLQDEDLLTLFLCMPFRRFTWSLLDENAPNLRQDYWKGVNLFGFGFAPSELNEIIDGLLEVNRPLEAFNVVDWCWNSVETSRLKRLLTALAVVEPYGHIDQFSLSSAFEALDKRSDVTPFEKASLEFTYVSGLAQSEHGIPNLEHLVASTPSAFVELIEAVYGHTPDPNSQEPEVLQRQARGTAAYFTLQRIRRTPGSDESGNIDSEKLKSWLTEVRTLSAKLDLTGACDTQIGQLLSRAPADDDGYWPCPPVCEALEWIASENVSEGFMIGVANSRGAMVRGRGGDQERELAEKYRAYAKRTAYEYPFTSSTLRRLADQYDREAKWWDDRAEVGERLDG